jgi:hypothetical protein
MLYEVAAQIRFVVIDHDSFYIIDIKTQGIAEEQNEQQRKCKRQIQAPEIAYQMIELLASDSFNISQSQW